MVLRYPCKTQKGYWNTKPRLFDAWIAL